MSPASMKRSPVEPVRLALFLEREQTFLGVSAAIGQFKDRLAAQSHSRAVALCGVPSLVQDDLPMMGAMTDNSKDILSSPEMNFMWKVHYLSSLVVQPVFPNITLPYDLPLINWRVIVTLAHAPDMSAQEISDLWALDKMAVSRAVNALLRRKLITRTLDREDRRRKPLALTDKGLEIFRKCWPTAKASYRKLTSALSPAELGQFLSISEKLIVEARQMVKSHLDRAAIEKAPGA